MPNTLSKGKVNVGAISINGTDLTGAELAAIDGVTAGVVTASKAAIVDSNKDIGDFRNLDVTNLDAGLSGTAGTMDVFPTTAAKGKLAITAADSAGDTTTTIVNASQAAARTYTIPDGGASASFLLTQGAQTVAGVNTFTSPIVHDHNTSITAFATGGQASATALTGEYNNVTVCATAGDSVKLLTAVAGQIQTVKNSGAASLDVFPNTSDSINALAINLAVAIDPGSSMTFRAIDATVWETQEVLTLPAPTTAKGNLVVKATDNTGNTAVTVTNAAHGQATVITLPDVGLATSYVAQSTAALTAAEVNVLDGATAGTVVASKAVVVDANKDSGDFRNLDAVNIDAGADAVAGTVDVFPATTARGKLIISATNNTGATNVTLTNAAHGQATVVTIPDSGLATSYVAQSTAALTVAETDVLDGATAGTVVASKAVVVDANKDSGDFRNLDAVNIDAGADAVAGTVDIFPATTARGKLIISATDNTGATNVTVTNAAHGQATVVTIPDVGLATSYVAQSTAALTAAEVNVLDSATAGTVVASKAVVVDANKDIGDFRNLDVVNLDAGADAVAGTVDVFPATTARGKLIISATDNTGATNVTLTNAAHGQATVVTIPDVGLATSYVVQSTAALTAAEANFLDGATAGTQVASKAVIADANVNIGVAKITALHIGTSGSETQVNATAAELNNAADISAMAAIAANGATLSVVAATHAGKVIEFGTATGTIVTLPAATGLGHIYRFVIGVTATSNANIIKVANATDVMAGSVNLQQDTDVGGTLKMWAAAATDDTMTFAGAATTGGIVGGYIECVDYKSGFWSCRAFTQSSGGAEATPFSATV